MKKIILMLYFLYPIITIYCSNYSEIENLRSLQSDLYENIIQNNIDKSLELKNTLDDASHKTPYMIFDFQEDLCIEILLKDYDLLSNPYKLEELYTKHEKDFEKLDARAIILRQDLFSLLSDRYKEIVDNFNGTREYRNFIKIVIESNFYSNYFRKDLFLFDKEIDDYILNCKDSSKIDFIRKHYKYSLHSLTVQALFGASSILGVGDLGYNYFSNLGFDIGMLINLPNPNLAIYLNADVIFFSALKSNYYISGSKFEKETHLILNDFSFQLGYPITLEEFTITPLLGFAFLGYQNGMQSNSVVIYSEYWNLACSLSTFSLPINSRLSFADLNIMTGINFPLNFTDSTFSKVRPFVKIDIALGVNYLTEIFDNK